jgi:hypothetical protein
MCKQKQNEVLKMCLQKSFINRGNILRQIEVVCCKTFAHTKIKAGLISYVVNPLKYFFINNCVNILVELGVLMMT